MSKKKKATKSTLAQSMINPDFMQMSTKELDDFDKEIDTLLERAEKDLGSTPWKKNDTYVKNDIFAEKGGDVE